MNTIWVLILFAHAGTLSDSDSMALTNVSGFKTYQECKAAGEEAKRMASGTTKVIKYSCTEVLK
jgi:hypothetical protein